MTTNIKTDIDALFPSKFLKAADFPQPRVLKIQELKVEPVGQQKEVKPVLYFLGELKAMVLNKTNSRTIARDYGKDYSRWTNKPIEIFSTMVEFQGEMRDALRIRIPEGPTSEPESAPEY